MAVCFALGQKISETRVRHLKMRSHLFDCYEAQQLTRFFGLEGKERSKFTGRDSRFEMRIPKLWHKLRPLDAPSKSKPPTKKSRK